MTAPVDPDMPDTFVGALENIIRWLDMTDPIINEKYPHVAKGRDVQKSLERLAAALATEPKLDEILMSMMRGE